MRMTRSLALDMAVQQRAMGRRIAQAREQLHLTQEAAADRAGVTLRAYQKWEAGGGIQYDNLTRLARALNTTIETLTGEAETRAPDPFGSAQLDRIERLLIAQEELLRQIKAAVAVLEGARLTGPAAESQPPSVRPEVPPVPGHGSPGTPPSETPTGDPDRPASGQRRESA